MSPDRPSRPRRGPDGVYRPPAADESEDDETDRHERVARMRREGRLTDEEAHRAHRLIDAGRYDELGTLFRAKEAKRRGSRGAGFGPLLRIIIAVTAAVVLVDFVVGLF